jgi:hypothetical protein
VGQIQNTHQAGCQEEEKHPEGDAIQKLGDPEGHDRAGL